MPRGCPRHVALPARETAMRLSARLTRLPLCPVAVCSPSSTTVIDVFKTWCGPCEVIVPTFERVWLDYDEADKRVKFLAIDDSVLTDEQKEALPLHEGSKPLFLVYKVRCDAGLASAAAAASSRHGARGGEAVHG